MVEKMKGPVPHRADKSIKRESIGRYQRADTGGDPYDRMNGRYGKSDNDADDKGGARDYDADDML